jgi:hypothetical protein
VNDDQERRLIAAVLEDAVEDPELASFYLVSGFLSRVEAEWKGNQRAAEFWGAFTAGAAEGLVRAEALRREADSAVVEVIDVEVPPPAPEPSQSSV